MSRPKTGGAGNLSHEAVEALEKRDRVVKAALRANEIAPTYGADTATALGADGVAPDEAAEAVDLAHETGLLTARPKASRPTNADMLSIVELAEQPIDDTETLIGTGACRYLERGMVLMNVAPAGTGKSHLIEQGAVCFSCGLPAFDLRPTAPLRCLVVQAENPPNDARQIAANMLYGLDLEPKQRALVHENTRQVWLPGCTGTRFLIELAGLLDLWPADLVFIDPLAGFADGDLVRPEVVQEFCRTGLGKLAVERRCGLWIAHHVPKPNAQRDASRMGAYDFQYAGSGNADVAANWPRAVLTLQPLARGEFLLRAAKRRPPWVDVHDRQLWELGLRHTDAGVWDTFVADSETARTGRPAAPGPETHRESVIDLVRLSGAMPKTAFVETVRAKITGGRDTARAAVELLVADGSLATWRGAGRGGCAMIGLTSQAPTIEVRAA